MSYKEPPIPPPGVNQQKPVEVTKDTEPQNSDDIHLSTVQVDVPKDKPADEPVAYKEYYACAIGEAVPKPTASAIRKRGGSDSSTTPPTAVASPRPITTVSVALRLTAAAKGKQPARETTPTDPSEIKRTEAEQLKIVLKRSRHETHISQHGGSGTDEGTGSKPGMDENDDTESGGDDEEGENDEESDDEETRKEESFDPIPRTPKDSEDDGKDKQDQGFKYGEEEWFSEEEEADELFRDVDINQGRGLQ
nr:hypothetical protein [Tanacetum cinerariifolium]GFB05425.1 hypothetical protein [Tanacetum cinerariifolium]